MKRLPRRQAKARILPIGAKRLTPIQAKDWLLPMRRCLLDILRTGTAVEVDGRAMTVSHGGQEYVPINDCCAGFRGLIDRLFNGDVDSSPLRMIEERVSAGELLTESMVLDGLRFFNRVEYLLMRKTVAEVKDAVLVESIQIELDEMGVS